LEGRAELGLDKVRMVTFIIFSMLYLILRRHVRGFEVACPYERDQKFQGNGTITGLDEAPNSSGSNGKTAIVM
jgi:hypothetical protein